MHLWPVCAQVKYQKNAGTKWCRYRTRTVQYPTSRHSPLTTKSKPCENTCHLQYKQYRWHRNTRKWQDKQKRAQIWIGCKTIIMNALVTGVCTSQMSKERTDKFVPIADAYSEIPKEPPFPTHDIMMANHWCRSEVRCRIHQPRQSGRRASGSSCHEACWRGVKPWTPKGPFGSLVLALPAPA